MSARTTFDPRNTNEPQASSVKLPCNQLWLPQNMHAQISTSPVFPPHGALDALCSALHARKSLTTLNSQTFSPRTQHANVNTMRAHTRLPAARMERACTGVRSTPHPLYMPRGCIDFPFPLRRTTQLGSNRMVVESHDHFSAAGEEDVRQNFRTPVNVVAPVSDPIIRQPTHPPRPPDIAP